MIKEDFVSFEIAKLLKEKGFDVDECEVYYDPLDHTQYDITLQMAMKWLREEHNLYVTSVPNGIGEDIFYPQVYKKFEWGWTVLDSSFNGFQDTEFSSPEEACEAAIKYCLENLI